MTFTEIDPDDNIAENLEGFGDGRGGREEAPGAGRPVPGPLRARIEAVPADVVDRLMAQVRTGDLELLGDGGVLAELAKKLLERALDEELTDQSGHPRGDPA